METPRLVVGRRRGATPRFRRRRLPHPRGGAHCFPFARARPPVLITRCFYFPSSSCVRIPHPAPLRAATLSQLLRTRVRVCVAVPQLFRSSHSCFRVGNTAILEAPVTSDILCINKQRLMAMGEPKKLQDENNLLLEEIRVLQTEIKGIPLESTQFNSGSHTCVLVTLFLPMLDSYMAISTRDIFLLILDGCSKLDILLKMKAIKYGSVPVQISFPSDESRESEEHDWHNTALSQYIISTYGDPSLSQVLDDFVSSQSHGRIAILSQAVHCAQSVIS
ncbi:hypothetical protein ZEAMMB73_Zm00001d018430 [Zea mays]|uniref:Uncharacterized protein n=1 Tax=Zea mays TaxID=4577 RepID=A0A1D6HNW0_MAIZE|nr:hypothetical protein ZEAMMB73_Zm00001d018430 [Zea mays]